ncbi:MULTISPECIES: hypothetical protein [Clostridium]|nr:hypothetical protein [Clostridium sporogenes]AJD31818.1 hypothetical protein T258_339 [Clostridium botulinum Prevot_594]KRU37706.1 hypothetical protein VT94_33030 [Clostridium sporogenes]MCW6065722.1 hypothetical protein [Clostridium sporogenes]MCW6090369.1 hypothetical protein [Clostridium sporogenes]MCW6121749.1 hypothetical protein [Clostridium sporogenes]
MGKTSDFKKIKDNYSTCITLTRCLRILNDKPKILFKISSVIYLATN